MPGRIVPLSGGVDQRAVVEHEEDVHAAEFLDPLALGGVEEDDLVAAVLDGFGLGDAGWRRSCRRTWRRRCRRGGARVLLARPRPTPASAPPLK